MSLEKRNVQRFNSDPIISNSVEERGEILSEIREEALRTLGKFQTQGQLIFKNCKNLQKSIFIRDQQQFSKNKFYGTVTKQQIQDSNPQLPEVYDFSPWYQELKRNSSNTHPAATENYPAYPAITYRQHSCILILSVLRVCCAPRWNTVRLTKGEFQFPKDLGS